MTDTTGFSTKQLLTLIAETNERIDRKLDEQRKTNRELANLNLTMVGILNRMDDRMNRLEAR